MPIVRTSAPKITAEEVWTGFAEFQKSLQELREIHKETDKGIAELRLTHQETEKALKEAIVSLRLTQQETDKRLTEGIEELRLTHQETEKSLKEGIAELRLTHQETEKSLKEGIAELRLTHQETEKTLNKAIGGLGNTMGSLVEQFMTTGLPQKFKQFGFTFDKITTIKWADGENNIYAEIDGLLENGKQAVVVEVKTTLRNEDVDDHLDRMEKVRKYADLHEDRRLFLGALASAVVSKNSRDYALKKGFFVIEPLGEDVKLTKPAFEKVW